MSLLEKICAACDNNCINELELKNLTEAIIHFKNDERYKELLEEYIFDEKMISSKMITDLSLLLVKKEVFYQKSNNSIFICMNHETINKINRSSDFAIVNSFLSDYRKFNTEKENEKCYKIIKESCK